MAANGRRPRVNDKSGIIRQTTVQNNPRSTLTTVSSQRCHHRCRLSTHGTGCTGEASCEGISTYYAGITNSGASPSDCDLAGCQPSGEPQLIYCCVTAGCGFFCGEFSSCEGTPTNSCDDWDEENCPLVGCTWGTSGAGNAASLQHVVAFVAVLLVSVVLAVKDG